MGTPQRKLSEEYSLADIKWFSAISCPSSISTDIAAHVLNMFRQLKKLQIKVLQWFSLSYHAPIGSIHDSQVQETFHINQCHQLCLLFMLKARWTLVTVLLSHMMESQRRMSNSHVNPSLISLGWEAADFHCQTKSFLYFP